VALDLPASSLTITIDFGFGCTSSTSRSQVTPRNLFGFTDGTVNVKAEVTAIVDDSVWVSPGDAASWMVGGSYLVARRIRMTIETMNEYLRHVGPGIFAVPPGARKGSYVGAGLFDD
jgi:hypothetical protein